MKNSYFRLILPATILFLPAIPAHAAFVFSVQSPIAADTGSTGNVFDVLLTNTGSSPVTIGNFTFGITTANPGITFTSANFATVVDPYIFAGDSFDQFAAVPLNLNSGTELDASDQTFSGNGVSVDAGVTFGLGHVFFDVSNGATTGPTAVTFTGFTSLVDTSVNPVPFTTSAGTIDVSGPGAVPEPGTFVMVFCGLVGLGVLVRRL